MRCRILCIFAAILFVAAPLAAQTTDNITITVPTSATDATLEVFTFSLPSSPIVSSSMPGADFSTTADVTLNGTTVFTDDTIAFLGDKAKSAILDSDQLFSVAPSGQLYTGSETDPTLILGTSTGYASNGQNQVIGNGTVEIAAADIAATPEPSSLILLGTGIVGTLAAARRRFKA